MQNIDIEKIHLLQKEYLGLSKPVNNTEPKVSVFVTAYQHVSYIIECLDSILAQKTNFAFEIVLGEDQSTDGTREICIEFAEKHQNIIRLFLRDRKQTVLLDDTERLYKSINGALTLKACRGEYIAMCEGDDYWTDPYKLQKQVDIMEANPESYLCFHKVNIEKDGVILKNTRPNCFMDKNVTFEEFVKKDPIQTCSVLFKASILRNYPSKFYEFKVGDYPLFMLALDMGPGLYMDEIMSVYRVHDKGVWSGMDNIAGNKIKIDMYEKINEYFSYKYNKLFTSVLCRLNCLGLTYSVKNNNYGSAFNYAANALKNCRYENKDKFVSIIKEMLVLLFPRLHKLYRKAIK